MRFIEKTFPGDLLRSHLSRINRYLQEANLKMAKDELENAGTRFLAGGAGLFHRAKYRLAVMHACVLDRDPGNYEHNKITLKRLSSDDRVIAQWTDPWIRLLDTDLHHRLGEMERATEIVDKALGDLKEAKYRKFRFRFLLYRALMKSRREKPPEISPALEEARSLMALIPGADGFIRFHMIKGAVLLRTGPETQGERHLDRAVKKASEAGNPGLWAAANCHKACCFLASGNEEKARQCLKPAISFMARHGLSSLETVQPAMMTRIFRAAASMEIEPAFVKQAAKDSLNISIETDRPPIPLLQIRTLGQFTMGIPGGHSLKITGLGNNLRKILSILVASPHKRINTEQIQTSLWPESNAKQGRQRLDTTLNRLKNEIAKNIAPQRIVNYINVRKGQFRLQNYRLDSDDFQCQANLGQGYAEREMKLLAGNHFRRAFELWNGDYLPLKFSDELHLKHMADHLVLILKQCAESWSDVILREWNCQAEDINRISKTLQLNCDNPPFLRKIYQIHTRHGNTGKAADFLIRCHETFLMEGLAPGEADEAMNLILERKPFTDSAPDTHLDTENQILYR